MTICTRSSLEQQLLLSLWNIMEARLSDFDGPACRHRLLLYLYPCPCIVILLFETNL